MNFRGLAVVYRGMKINIRQLKKKYISNFTGYHYYDKEAHRQWKQEYMKKVRPTNWVE